MGNEHRQVIKAVLTSHEGQRLLPMTTVLVKRYDGDVFAPPKLLYVDRDCCSSVGTSRAAAIFSGWRDLESLTEATEQLIGEMLEAFKDARETTGIRHLGHSKTQSSLHPDPPGVQLYTQAGSITNGGLTLPVYSCAHGSLESFHKHFILGKIMHIHLKVCFRDDSFHVI